MGGRQLPMPAVVPVSVLAAAALGFPKKKGSGRSGLRGSACAITSETRRLIDCGSGCLRWTRWRETLDASLDSMRMQMSGSMRPSAAMFVGSVESESSEYERCRELLPRRPKIPIAGRGCAAARLSMADAREPDLGEELIRSERYLFVAARVISAIASRSGTAK